MTTKESKETAVAVEYEKLQEALSRLGIVYNIPSSSHVMSDVQNAIGEYADAEIALHSHVEEPVQFKAIKDSHLVMAHIILSRET